MAVTGFVLINTAPTKEHVAYSGLQDIDEIVGFNNLFGEHGIIAKVEATDFNALGQVVLEKIRAVKGVIDTRSLIGIKL